MPKPTLESEITPLSKAEIDELAQLEDAWNHPVAQQNRRRRETLASKARKQCEAEPADEPVKLVGNEWVLFLGERKMERQADPEIAFNYLKRRVGAKELWQYVKITLKTLEELFTEDALDAWVTKSRTGSRDIKPVLKEAA